MRIQISERLQSSRAYHLNEETQVGWTRLHQSSLDPGISTGRLALVNPFPNAILALPLLKPSNKMQALQIELLDMYPQRLHS
jgi:hypothetical protein